MAFFRSSATVVVDEVEEQAKQTQGVTSATLDHGEVCACALVKSSGRSSFEALEKQGCYKLANSLQNKLRTLFFFLELLLLLTGLFAGHATSSFERRSMMSC